ncbi:MAG: amidohydrolase [Gammaproteobacteria bacterium]
MANVLRVALAQVPLLWHDTPGNHAQFDALIDDAGDFDLLVLPEMFASGFSMSPAQCAQDMDGPSVTWMRELAARRNAAICGSLAIRDGEHFVNRFVFMYPDGAMSTYDKRHSFTLAGEHEVYTAGNERSVIEFRGWRLAPFVCYDLRFPVWCRHAGSCDLMLFVANWPQPRRTAWNTLLRARAIENQCFVAGVNRVGTDHNEREYFGDSAVVDALGDDVVNANDRHVLEFATLDLGALHALRERLPFYRDADAFDVKR